MSTMVVNTTALIEQFSLLGISEYEARVYTSLLEHPGSTAYEAAKAASVPTSKVYGVLDRLEARGMVRWDERTSRKLYWPQPASEFVEATRGRLRSTLDSLKADLENMGPPTDSVTVWPLTSEIDLKDKALRLVTEAQKFLFISGWNQELKDLTEAVFKARRQGLNTAVVHFGPGSLPFEGVYHHPLEQTLYQERGGRGLTMAIDGQVALMATIRDEVVVEGAWSHNHAFVTLAEDYIKHDIYLMKIVERFSADLQRKFGPNYEKLREVWYDQEVEK